MEDVRLGASGLKISRITLGCISFGDGSRPPWATSDDERAEPILRQTVASGTITEAPYVTREPRLLLTSAS